MATRQEIATGLGNEHGSANAAVARRKRGGVARARKRIADAMPEIAELLLEKAKEGSVPHLKLALELGGVEKRAPKPANKPAYSQRVERQLLQELDEMSRQQ